MDFDYRLLAKYLIDTLSPEEMGKVQEWRVLSIDNEYVFSKLVELRISVIWKPIGKNGSTMSINEKILR